MRLPGTYTDDGSLVVIAAVSWFVPIFTWLGLALLGFFNCKRTGNVAT